MVTIKKVIIRKTDATASIVLFIFDSFLLPKGISRISLRKLFDLLKPFEKSETSIRMGLSRAVKSGMLKNIKENEQVYYEIREAGLKTLEEWKEEKINYWRRISLKKNGWNNYWCMVSVTAPKETEGKDKLISYLKKSGFGKLNSDTYIHPLDMTKDIEAKIENQKLNDNVKVFLTKLTSSQNPAKLAFTTWDVDGLRRKYTEFSVKYPPTLGPWNTGDNEKLIPFCHSFINDFTEIMKDDPVLPNEFLGLNWEGDNALRLLDHFNKIIVPRTKDVVEKIMKEGA